MTRLHMALLLQGDANREETTTIVDQAGEGAAETAGETARILSDIVAPFQRFFGYLLSAEFLANVIAAAVVVIMGIVVYAIVSRIIPLILRWRRDDETLDEEAIARIKRQDTTVALVRNVLRYVVFVVLVLIVLSIFLQNILATVGGAAILAAVIGFGAQSFLRDIIAGFSVVFEGQYAVGDFIEVHPPQGVGGVVEELGLRITKIRTLSGELVFVPNGAMTGVTTYTSGQERFNVEVQLRSAEAAERVENSLGEASELYVTPPRLTNRTEEQDGRVRLHIRAGILPSMSWLVEDNLTERIKAAAGEEDLASEPLVYKVDQASLRRIRGLLPQESRNKIDRR